MKILVELPTWIGDVIMTTPALENLFKNFKKAEIVLVGPKISIDLIKDHPSIFHTIEIKKDYLAMFRLARKLGSFDFFISFRNSARSNFFKLLISSKKKFHFIENNFPNCHQVEKYNKFICQVINKKLHPGPLNLYPKFSTSKMNLIGINPGASYGSAKRWYPERFAEVISNLNNKYKVIIFGSSDDEKSIASEILSFLDLSSRKQCVDLTGKTDIYQLKELISKLDLFITGDSGPMHIASAYNIPTIAIFGPTNFLETSQWNKHKKFLIKSNLDCQPCMKRQCPLGHHNCMKQLESIEVIDVLKKLNFAN